MTIFGGVLYEEEYAEPIKRALWERHRPVPTEFRLGSYTREPPADYEKKFFREIRRVAWIQEASNYQGDLDWDLDFERRGAALWISFRGSAVRNRGYNVGDLICAMRDVIKAELGDGFIGAHQYSPSFQYKRFVKENPVPARPK